MKNTIINIIKNKKAVTLMEIMIALCILAFTFIPVIGTLTKSAKDTETFNSYVFAQTTARNILDTILDDVPFHSIKIGSGNKVTFINSTVYNINNHSNIEYNVTRINNMLASNPKHLEGHIEGDRGIDYEVTVYAFPIAVDDLKFTYLLRPNFGSEPSWYTYDKNETSAYRKDTYADPYIYSSYESVNEASKEWKNSQELGAKNYTTGGSTDGYCCMKKIVITLKWKVDNIERKLSLYTMKANLDSER